MEDSFDKIHKGPEALEWLKNNNNPSALASNAFGETQGAIEFVEKLYAKGANKVMIAEGCIRDAPETIKLEKGSYADGLVVQLPSDKEKRERVLKLCKSECDYEFEGSLEDEIVADRLFMWWD